jgi:hypothetical protein
MHCNMTSFTCVKFICLILKILAQFENLIVIMEPKYNDMSGNQEIIPICDQVESNCHKVDLIHVNVSCCINCMCQMGHVFEASQS